MTRNPPGVSRVGAIRFPPEMARGIVRYSLDRDGGNVSGNKARAALEVDGTFSRIGTGALEADGPSFPQIAARLRHFLEEMEAAHASDRAITVDHVWIYVDNATQSGTEA